MANQRRVLDYLKIFEKVSTRWHQPHHKVLDHSTDANDRHDECRQKCQPFTLSPISIQPGEFGSLDGTTVLH